MMTRPIILAFLLFSAVVSRAQTPAPVQKTDAASAPKASIEGVVLNAATGEPLKKARVTLFSVGGRGRYTASATTNAEGRFALRELPTGNYRLTADRNGFVRSDAGPQAAGRPGGTQVTLEEGKKVQGVVLKLMPGAVLSGRIFDEDGDPLFGVIVQALRRQMLRGQATMMPAQSTQTNDLGEYRLSGLAAGRVYLVASYPQGAGQSGENRATHAQAYVPTFYPGTPEYARALPLTLVAGQETSRVDLTLTPVPAVSVRGRVILSAGGDVRGGTSVTLIPRITGARVATPYGQFPATVQDPQGTFEIRGVAPGTYIVQAMAFDKDRAYSAREVIDVGRSDVEGITLTPLPAIDVPGRVRIEENPEFKFAGGNVLLTPNDEGFGPWGAGANGPIGADGSFTVRNVLQSTFRVTLGPLPENTFLKSVRYAGEEALESGVDLTRRGAIEITLSNKGARIEGSVVNDSSAPAIGATIVVIPEKSLRQQMHLFKVVTTDQAGRFAFSGIAPGTYQVVAWEEIEPGLWQSPEILDLLERKGETLHAEPSGSYTLQLKALPPPN